MHNKHIKNRPQKAWAGLATARLLCGRYKAKEFYFLVGFKALLFVNFKQ
jgi:hypothetical protein